MYGDTIYLTMGQKRTVGRRMRYIRRLKNWSLQELANQLKMPVECVRRMENGDFELFDDFQ